MLKSSAEALGFRNILFCVVAFVFSLSWLLPNHSAPWPSFCQDAFSFLGVFLLALCVRNRVSFTRFEVFLVLVSFLPILQWFCGVIWFRGDAVIYFFYLLVFAIFICFSRNLVGGLGGSEKALTFFFSVVLFSSIISVWISLRQWLQFDSVLWIADLRRGGRPFANFAQPNNYASFLLLAMVGVGYLFNKGRLGAFVSCFLALFLLFGMALSQSRTPVVGGIFALAWFFWGKGNIRVRSWGVLLIFSAYLGFLAFIPLLSEWLNISALSLLDRVRGVERLGLWMQIWGALKNAPFWGYGWGQVSVAQISVALLYPGIPITEYSHNIILDILVWNGLIPGACLLALSCFFILKFVRRSGSVESFFCLLAIGFMGVHSLLEYPFAYAFFLFPIAFLLGVLQCEVNSYPVLSVKLKYMHGFIVISIVVLIVFVFEYFRVEEDYRLMRFESAKIGHVVHDKVAPDVFFLDQISGYIRFARTPATQGMSENDISFVKKISHRYPYSSSIFRYALVLGLNGRVSEAENEMLILRSIHGEGAYGEGLVALKEMEGRYPQLGALIMGLADL